MGAVGMCEEGVGVGGTLSYLRRKELPASSDERGSEAGRTTEDGLCWIAREALLCCNIDGCGSRAEPTQNGSRFEHAVG